jgi:hypothetical protein
MPFRLVVLVSAGSSYVTGIVPKKANAENAESAEDAERTEDEGVARRISAAALLHKAKSYYHFRAL